MLNKCFINGRTMGFNAAFQIDSKAEISPDLLYLGRGEITEVKGKPYSDGEWLKFYINKDHRSI